MPAEEPAIILKRDVIAYDVGDDQRIRVDIDGRTVFCSTVDVYSPGPVLTAGLTLATLAPISGVDVLAPLRVAGVASKNRCDKATPERVVEMATQRIVDLQREVTRLREAARQHAEAMHGKSVRRKLREVAGLLVQVRDSLGRDPPEAAGDPDLVPTTPSAPAPVQAPASATRPFEVGDLVFLGPGLMPLWDGVVLRVVDPGQPVEVEGRTFGGLKSLGTFRAEQLRRAPAGATFGEGVS